VKRWRQAADVAARRVDDRVVLVNLQTNHIYSLNTTGSQLWDRLNEARTRDDLVSELRSELDGDPEEIARETDRLLGELEEASLVTVDG
jgi:hypothetical protein